MVDDGKGKFYPLIVGTAIGMNQGRVAQILIDRVIVEEATKERGKKKVKRIIIKLRRDEEERKP
jgi:Tfp pilus assembly protein PilP